MLILVYLGSVEEYVDVGNYFLESKPCPSDHVFDGLINVGCTLCSDGLGCDHAVQDVVFDDYEFTDIVFLHQLWCR